MSRVTDVMYAFPGLLFVVLVIAVFGAGITTSVLGLGLALAPTIAKHTRSVALAERAKPYVDAYRVQGMGGLRSAYGTWCPTSPGRSSDTSSCCSARP